MPSAEETSYMIEVMPDSGQDNFTSHDVDVLVSRIKENLRLSGLKTKRRSRCNRRMPYKLPYKLPYRDWSDDYNTDRSFFSSRDDVDDDDDEHEQQGKSLLRRKCRKNWKLEDSKDDSYERFKALLRNGLLIKEAVKRLQICDEEDDDKEDSWEEESTSTRRVSTTSATSTNLDGLDSMDD